MPVRLLHSFSAQGRGLAPGNHRFPGEAMRCEFSEQKLEFFPVLRRQLIKFKTATSGLDVVLSAMVESDIINDSAGYMEQQEVARFGSEDIHLYVCQFLVFIIYRVLKGGAASAHILDFANPVQAWPEGQVEIGLQGVSRCLPTIRYRSLAHVSSPWRPA